MINRRFAMDYPQKLNKVVILNSPHNRGDELQSQVEARAKSVREQGVMSTLPAAIQRWFTQDYLASETGPKQVTAWREQVDPESYAQTNWVLAHGVRELIEPTPAIRVEALVMSCENDVGSTPEMAYAIADELEGPSGKNTPCLILPKLRHLGVMENPAAFTDPILEFLKQSG